MSGTSRGAQSSIRESIRHLCDILNASGIGPIAPETIRQAKFDKPEAVSRSECHFSRACDIMVP